MVTLRVETERIAKGWITSAAIDASSSYLITNFSIASDQYSGSSAPLQAEWLAPLASSIIPQLSTVDRMLGGMVRLHGLYNAQMIFSYWTAGMMKAFKAAIFTDPLVSEAVTIKMYDSGFDAVYMQCYLDPLILPGVNGDPAPGGWQNVKLNFSGGALV